jgi:uncharacterized protein (TIGR00730 family)
VTYAVCVFCASSPDVDDASLALAGQVGTAIATQGWVLVSGGGAVSMMGAVARAARAAGGHTVGVIPTVLTTSEVADHDAGELIETPDMRTRKAEMDRRADAFLTLPGGIGTLEELFEAWTARTLGLHDKPVVVCDPAATFAGLRALIEDLHARGFVRASALRALVWADTVPAAIEALRPPRTP